MAELMSSAASSVVSAASIKRRQITTQRVDSFSKHFLPAAYAFSLALVIATHPMDHYKDNYTVESYQGMWPDLNPNPNPYLNPNSHPNPNYIKECGRPRTSIYGFRLWQCLSSSPSSLACTVAAYAKQHASWQIRSRVPQPRRLLSGTSSAPPPPRREFLAARYSSVDSPSMAFALVDHRDLDHRHMESYNAKRAQQS